MSKISPPCVLSIAGTDPSGGAGIHADIKTISATGSYAAAVITALVAQNTQTVYSVCDIPADFFKQQLKSVFDDLDIKAIKIGMLHTAEIIHITSEFLTKYQQRNIPIVIDPVMVAKNGASLLPSEIIEILKNNLFHQASIITPNIPEAEKLLDLTITSVDKMQSAAQLLGEKYHTHVLLKGGHLDNKLEPNNSADVLYNVISKKFSWFSSPKIQTKNTHGTGCTLSSALASYLAQGFDLEDAVKSAKAYLTQAILSGREFSIGKGFGPVDHFYYLRDKKYVTENNKTDITVT